MNVGMDGSQLAEGSQIVSLSQNSEHKNSDRLICCRFVEIL